MAVVIETTVGDITVDLFTEERPQTCKNFLKLCKIKYYNFCLFHSIQANFIAQSGDPTGVGTGGESVFGIVYGSESRYYEGEKLPKIKHSKPGLLSMVNCGNNMLGSQFFVTLGTDLQSLEEHCVFAEVTEGHDVLIKLNDAICDHQHRPYQDIRITHTVILDDPFEDLPGLSLPIHSPDISQLKASNGRIGADEKINEEEGLSEAQLHELKAEREAKARATILEIVGDLPDADIAPPENVLFVCKLNPVTTDEDLEIIFSRFGKVKSCEVIRDHATGESLQYAFVEFEEQRACEQAYLKMDNVLIDDRRIHVDFSQSVAKIKWKGKGRGVQYFDKVDEKEIGKSNSERYTGGKRDHYRERDRDRDRDRNDRRGRDDDRRRRGGDREMDDHRNIGRRNDKRRDDRWGCEEDRWEEDRKRRDDRRKDDDRRYGRRGDDRRRSGADDERRRGADDKKRNGTDRRSGIDKDRRNDIFDIKESRNRESKTLSSSTENKDDNSRRESTRSSMREKTLSIKKVEDKVVNSNAEHKVFNKDDVVKEAIGNNSLNIINQEVVVLEPAEVFGDNHINDKNKYKEEVNKLTNLDVTRTKKKRRRASSSSDSTSSETSDSTSSSSSIDKKKKSKRSLTVAKKYYHKGKLVKVVKKKKKSSDSETLSDESSESDKKRKRRKYKKIIKVIKRRRQTTDDSDTDSSSSDDSDSSRYRKKRRKSERNNKKKRKDNLKKNKKKKHCSSESSEENEEEKDKKKK